MKSPKYLKSQDDFVLDEMCSCGHLKSHHGSLLHKEHSFKENNAGNCCAGACDCPQFTWERFVLLEEYAEIIKSLRPLEKCSA